MTGLLEDEEQRRNQRQLQQQQVASAVFKVLLIVASFVVFCLLFLLFAIEVGGTDVLKWFDSHPAASSQYNPHHRVTRILAWTIVLLFLHQVWRVVFRFAKRLFLWWKVMRKPAKKKTDN